MRILITGGAGFIGSNLAKKLIENKDIEIHILDIKENPINLKNIRGVINYIQGDVKNRKLLYDILTTSEFDGIIHLSAVSRVIWGEQNPKLCVSTNVDGTKILMETISKLDKKPWVIFGSSREVYGEPKLLPVKENAKKEPINIYGKTKLEGENLINYYSKIYGIKSLILRFSNVYGNEMDILDRVIPRFVLRALRGEVLEIHGGSQIFDFTYIDDTVNAIKLAIDYLEENSNPLCEDIHILPGMPVKIVDLPDLISQHVKQDVKIKFMKPRNYDVDRFYGDPTKAEELIGFTAKVNINKGIKLTVERFEEVFL